MFVVLFVLVLFLFLVCVWTSSLLHIYLLSNSSRSVDRPCHELDRQSLQKSISLLSNKWKRCCKTTALRQPARIQSGRTSMYTKWEGIFGNWYLSVWLRTYAECLATPQRPAKGLVDESLPSDTQVLGASDLPCMELLHASSRFRAEGARTEAATQWTGQNTVPALWWKSTTAT